MPVPCFQPDCLCWILLCLQLQSAEPECSPAFISGFKKGGKRTFSQSLLHISSLMLYFYDLSTPVMSFVLWFLPLLANKECLVAATWRTFVWFGATLDLGSSSWWNNFTTRSISSCFSRVTQPHWEDFMGQVFMELQLLNSVFLLFLKFCAKLWEKNTSTALCDVLFALISITNIS